MEGHLQKEDDVQLIEDHQFVRDQFIQKKERKGSPLYPLSSILYPC